MSTTPAELLARVALKDRRAFHDLYQQTSAHLFGAALRICKRRDWAEEAVQEAYVQVWNRAAEYRPERGNPLAWMTTIARYRALDMLRRTKREVDEEYAPEAVAPDQLFRLHAQADLALCWDELSEDQQQCINLAYVHGMSHQELSEHIESPLGTVKSWIRRGLAALKECLTR